MDGQEYLSDPPAAADNHGSRRRRRKLLPALVTFLALAGGGMLLAASFVPVENLPLCTIKIEGGGQLDIGILGSCSAAEDAASSSCQMKLGLKIEDTGLSRKQQDKLAGGLLDQVSYVFIFAPIAGGLAYVATLLSALGHFFKTSCFVFFGEGNVAAFACTTFAGLAGLAAFSVVLAFLVFANANLQHAALHLHVLAVALTLAGGILLFTAFLLSLILFNLSYSSGVLEAGDLDPNQEAQSEQTETDFWTDGERAERNEQLLRVQEQAEKNTLKSIKENDLKQMNAFLSRGQPTPTFEAAFDHPQTPRLKKKTPSTTTGKSNKYSNSWNRPTSRFDDAPLPPLPTPRSGRTSRRDTLPDTDDEQEMLDSVKPLDAFYKAKAPRRGFEPPPPAPTSSRYSQNTGYLQSVAPTASDLSQMPSAAEAREKANAVFEKQKQKHQSVAPSSVYSQM